MPKEQTIIAYFPSSTKAEKAATALAGAGFGDVHVKRVSRFGVTHDPHINDPVSNAESLTGLTLFSTDVLSDEKSDSRVLMAADPSVSGLSARGYGMAGGRAFTLVAFVAADRVEEAVNIIRQNGGDV
jgi:rhodanese-related sulfurtransferase